MIGNFKDFTYNPNISFSKYDINNVPTKAVDGQDVYSYNSYHMFKTPRKALRD